MIFPIPSSRAALRAAILALGSAELTFACSAEAFTPTAKKAGGEALPLNLSSSSTGAHTSSGGAGIGRTILALVIVIALIWAVTWVLRQVKSGKETRAAGVGLASMSTLPLGSGRSLHLVRAGRDYVLLGSAEQGVVPIYRYTEQQARDAGLLDDQDGASGFDNSGVPGGTTSTGRRGLIQFSGAGSAKLVDRLRGMTVRQ